MAVSNTTHDKRDLAYPAAEDRKVQAAVLGFLFDADPDRLTIPELSREMNAGPADFETEDAVERAVRELVGAGLLHCKAGLILPTRAALHYHRLDE